MQPSTLLLALPALAAAQQQVPLFEKAKGMFEQAAATFQKATGTQSFTADPERLKQHSVTPLTLNNWKGVLQHSGQKRPYDPPEAWMVYISGGNNTCHGRCGKADKAWKESVPWLREDVSAPRLATIDCEQQEVMCGAWAVTLPSVWMILLPQPLPDKPTGPTIITEHRLNVTEVTDATITNIHTRREYLAVPPYEGAFHPFDGWIGKFGLTEPLGYTLFYMSKIPNWVFMIGLSLFSRYFMSRRMPRPENRQPAAGDAASGAAAQ